MNNPIKEYYEKLNVRQFLIDEKLKKFEQHKDIAAEFEYWIKNNCYMDNGCVIDGYSASSLSKISKYLNGEGAFIMLIELREDPQRAHKRIDNGFKIR